jgi:hypothetical protein
MSIIAFKPATVNKRRGDILTNLITIVEQGAFRGAAIDRAFFSAVHAGAAKPPDGLLPHFGAITIAAGGAQPEGEEAADAAPAIHRRLPVEV